MDEKEDYTLTQYEAMVEGIAFRAWESYDRNDVIELACLIDFELRKENITMTFAWLWVRATDFLNEW